MEFKETEIKACCNKKQKVFILSKPIETEYIQLFTDKGFKTLSSYLKQGIFYIEDTSVIVAAPIGSNRLIIRNKIANIDNSISLIKDILNSIG